MRKAHWLQLVLFLVILCLTIMLGDVMRQEMEFSPWFILMLLVDMAACFGFGVVTVAIHFYESGMTLGPERRARE